MSRIRSAVLVAALSAPLAAPALAQEPDRFSIRISLSPDDPDAYAGVHEGTEPLDFWVFAVGERTRGGEFGLSLSGATCIGFVLDADVPWVSLPLVRPYPGTIAQVTAGEDCYESPLCLGKLTVQPLAAGGRITVDVIPSERAQDVTMLDCDYRGTNVLLAYPAVVNAADDEVPAPHLLWRPERPGSIEEPGGHGG